MEGNNGGSGTPTPPLTPKPNHFHNHHHQHHQVGGGGRSDSANPYPTTFVQADTTNFKQVVQMLTGSPDTAKHATDPPQQQPPPSPSTQSNKHYVIPPVKTSSTPNKKSYKQLYERRHNRNNLMINTLIPCFASNNNNNNSNNFYSSSPTSSSFSPRNKVPEILSPSILDFPKLALSPVTPLINKEDPFNKTSPSLGNYCNSSSSSSLADQEERAIAEKGFYMHPSPMSTPRESEPQLLSLFPVTSPRVSGSSS
ncbi:hypothetical protein ACFE04_006337 [Oxalis oulophora]